MLALVACDGGPTPPDASPDASASVDGGGPHDAGRDSGTPATMDGGASDAGADGGDIASDAGSDDAGSADAGSADAGPDDAGSDAGLDGGGIADAGEDGGPTSAGCGSNADCADTELCRKPVGMCGGVGVCEARPFFCSFVYLPVCGCDGATYSNECNARAAGVSVDRDGECASAAGCASNADCAGGQFCHRPAGDCGAPGTCEDRPFICGGIFLPVCGCDGVTYDNECNAHGAGTSVSFEGNCGG